MFRRKPPQKTKMLDTFEAIKKARSVEVTAMPPTAKPHQRIDHTNADDSFKKVVYFCDAVTLDEGLPFWQKKLCSELLHQYNKIRS